MLHVPPRLTLVAFALVAATITQGCSRAGAAETWQPDPKLVEAAKKEGQLLLYTTHIVDQIVRPLTRAFQSYVPGVDVKYVRADGLQLVVRLTNEARASRVQADVWCLVDGVHALLQGGFAAEFEVPSAQELPPGLADPRKRWIATNVGVRSAAYNTRTVPADQAPKSYQDLLDPRWKGKMVWNPKSMTGAWGFISTAIKGMGDEAGMAYLRALAKQQVVPLPIAIRAVLDRVIAGEYAIGLEMNNAHAAISEALGAPVKWVPLNPVSETLQVAGLAKDAPHPNAGKLFIDFMASRAGQQVFREHDYLPMHPDIPAKIPELKPQQGGYKSVLYTPDNLEVDVSRWAKIYEDLFR
ncbi:MAG: iron(III) transport system substrate-binding protein [Alphaproteobacteria bacterium]|nr:iron(III) transport system substrate-binding protein [Alphaproteobacteria bacterium]